MKRVEYAMDKHGQPANWPWKQTERSRKVKAADIILDRRLQPRAEMEVSLVKRYTTAMETGSQFPPVKVADIGGRLFLYCGWHRFEAAAVKLNMGKVEAEVLPMTFKAAGWEAAKDNLENGQTYRVRDFRRVFRAYVKAGQHKGGKDGSPFKSYREMERETQIKRSTLHNWMKADFPETFRAMGLEKDGNADADAPAANPEGELLRLIERSIKEASTYYDHLSTEEARFDAVAAVEQALERMKEKPRQEAVW